MVAIIQQDCGHTLGAEAGPTSGEQYQSVGSLRGPLLLYGFAVLIEVAAEPAYLLFEALAYITPDGTIYTSGGRIILMPEAWW
jgi:hypothetical protein